MATTYVNIVMSVVVAIEAAAWYVPVMMSMIPKYVTMMVVVMTIPTSCNNRRRGSEKYRRSPTRAVTWGGDNCSGSIRTWLARK